MPNFSGSATDTCNSIAAQDATNPDLVITGGGAAGSELLAKPDPGGISHAGGSFTCFGGAGADCYDTVVMWLMQGANGPGGNCGS